MPSFLKKLFFFALFLALFILVVLYLEPPKSWTEASLFQIMAFFLPLLLGLTIFTDLAVKYLPHSFIIGLGIILVLAFYSVNQLNYLTSALVVLIVAFLLRVFPKMKLPRFRLTVSSKIPKLHIQKQEPPRRHRLRR